MSFLDNISKKDIEQENDKGIVIEDFLKDKKKLISFLGSSKSGTSFLINSIATFLSMQGVDVAILDTTKNKNSYFIYTKNEEELRRIAIDSIDNLANGIANGIKVNDNLTVYTSIPSKYDSIKKVDSILQTLLKKHRLILLDCDFDTPFAYFSYSQEIYLVQTMDVLTIQPLTELLLKIKNTGIILDNKIKIIINKYVTLEGITEKEIIGGIAFYNDPSMSFMRELFNKNNVKYYIIPLDISTYTKYLNGIANCNVDITQFSLQIIQIIKLIASNIIDIQL